MSQVIPKKQVNPANYQIYQIRLRVLLGPMGRNAIPIGKEIAVRTEKDGTQTPYLRDLAPQKIFYSKMLRGVHPKGDGSFTDSKIPGLGRTTL